VLLETQYAPNEEKTDKDENKGKVHPIEDATVHFVVKKILEKQQTDSLSMLLNLITFLI
jgi:hypothetical protein